MNILDKDFWKEFKKLSELMQKASDDAIIERDRKQGHAEYSGDKI